MAVLAQPQRLSVAEIRIDHLDGAGVELVADLDRHGEWRKGKF